MCIRDRADVEGASGSSTGSGMSHRTRGVAAADNQRNADAGSVYTASFRRSQCPALRICQHRGCSRRPSFNHVGLRARFCSSHRELNMVDVAHKARCLHREVRVTTKLSVIAWCIVSRLRLVLLALFALFLLCRATRGLGRLHEARDASFG